MTEEIIEGTVLVSDQVYNDRMVIASIIIIILGILAYLALTVLLAALRQRSINASEREEMEAKFNKLSKVSAESIKASLERLHYTDQLMKLIEVLVQRSTAFHFYKQIGKLPLENFTGAMQETMISDIAKATRDAIDLDGLAAKSILSVNYLDKYIIDTAIITVDATLADLVNGEGRIISPPAIMKGATLNV